MDQSVEKGVENGEKKKNKHAQALGKLGGRARANRLSKERRVEIAKKAVAAREAKRSLLTKEKNNL